MSASDLPAFRIGVVGCGGISNSHGRAGLASDKLQLVACCDIRESVAREWAETYDCEAWYTDYEEMIRDQDLDGVVLATWPNQHREQIERCLNAGARNILSEKSLTGTGQEAWELAQLVESAGAFLMEGFMYRHHPHVAELERQVAAGTIGRIDSVRATFSAFDPEPESPTDPNRNWRRDPERLGGSPWDVTCYAINAANHFASIGAGGRGTGKGSNPDGTLGFDAKSLVAARPTRVWGVGSISKTYGTLNRQFGLIEYDSGCVGFVEGNRQAHLSEELQIAGSDGRLGIRRAFRPHAEPVIEHQYGKGEWREIPIPGAEMYRLQMENFADVAQGVAEPVMPLIQSVVNMHTISALVTSQREDRLVDVELPAGLFEEPA
ncbi:MAG: Gfo/Idh/MocA family oxidoreductase [Chloroflexi bacterium]|nr:Gfo/Idh/MocA family oxidoreductase [Chloroflexota bacterium]